jgi:AcrR family transcriptional regulator
VSNTGVQSLARLRVVGNREDLLAGARRCLVERGYANTTARDIAHAAGVSLAAIGYHFGSKERLLTEALAEATGSGLGDALEGRMRTAGAKHGLRQAFPQTWSGIESVFAENRESALASIENLLRIHRSPESLHYLVDAIGEAIKEFAAILRATHPGLDERRADAVGQLYFILLNGLAMQWVTGASLPSGEELALAVRTLSAD